MRHAASIAIAIAAITVLAALAPHNDARAEEYRMMTGPQGGAWYPLGGAVSNIVRRALPGVSIRILPGGGIANVLGVERGRAQLSFGNANSTADAVSGRPPFDEPATQVAHVATLYPQVFQALVAANAGIETVADLAGRSVAVGLRGHTGEQLARQVLDIYGLDYSDLSNVNHVNYTDSVSLMKDGHVDAFIMMTTIPSSAVMDVGTSRSVKILDIPDEKFEALREKYNPHYVRRVIPADTYVGQPQEILTFGTWTHLVARTDIPEETVYGMVKALVENRDGLAAIVSAMKDATIETFAIDVGVPFHPGAERFYRENGVMP